MAAIKRHDSELLAILKSERLNHVGQSRADRLHYYANRMEGRSPVGFKITLICDKMDGSKNYIPTFRRFPKDIDEKIKKNRLKLHIVGVIIHGKPDRRYFFAA